MIDVAERWDLLELDFHTVYGVDFSSAVPCPDGRWLPVLRVRSARWFMWRTHGLFADPRSRFARFIHDRHSKAESATEPPTVKEQVIV